MSTDCAISWLVVSATRACTRALAAAAVAVELPTAEVSVSTPPPTLSPRLMPAPDTTAFVDDKPTTAPALGLAPAPALALMVVAPAHTANNLRLLSNLISPSGGGGCKPADTTAFCSDPGPSPCPSAASPALLRARRASASRSATASTCKRG